MKGGSGRREAGRKGERKRGGKGRTEGEKKRERRTYKGRKEGRKEGEMTEVVIQGSQWQLAECRISALTWLHLLKLLMSSVFNFLHLQTFFSKCVVEKFAPFCCFSQ